MKIVVIGIEMAACENPPRPLVNTSHNTRNPSTTIDLASASMRTITTTKERYSSPESLTNDQTPLLLKTTTRQPPESATPISALAVPACFAIIDPEPTSVTVAAALHAVALISRHQERELITRTIGEPFNPALLHDMKDMIRKNPATAVTTTESESTTAETVPTVK
jgi:hypothetical protein